MRPLYRITIYAAIALAMTACADTPDDRGTAYGMQFVGDEYYLVATADDNGRQRWLYIDRDGRRVGRRDYASAQNYSEGLAMVTDDNGLIGYIDTRGEYRITPRFAAGTRCYDGLILACLPDSGIVVYDADGHRRFAMPQATSMSVYTDALARYTDYDGMVGYVDRDGAVVIEPRYENATIFVNGYATVQTQGRTLVIDRQGNAVTGRGYSGVLLPASNADHLIVRVDGRWGVVDTDGQYAITPQYHFIDNLANGYFAVQSDSALWGLCSPTGRMVVRPVYSKLGYGSVRSHRSYNPRLLIASTDGVRYGVIDVQGNVVMADRYAGIAISGDMILVKDGKAWGTCDEDGNEVYSPRFARLYPYLNGVSALASDDRLWGLADRSGRYIVQPCWSDVNVSEPSSIVYTDAFDADRTADAIVARLLSLSRDMSLSYDELMERYGRSRDVAIDDVRRGRGRMRLVYDRPINGHVRYDLSAEYPVYFQDGRAIYDGTNATTLAQYNFVFDHTSAAHVPAIRRRVLERLGADSETQPLSISTGNGALQLRYYPIERDNIISFVCHNVSLTDIEQPQAAE